MGHRDFGKIESCVCRKGDTQARRAQASGVSKAEQVIRLVDIDTQDGKGAALAVASLKEFVVKPVGIVTIWGGPGCGKSLSVLAACNELIALGKDAYYIRGPDLVECWHKGMKVGDDGDSEDASESLGRIKHAAVLVIDDFDKLHRTPWIETKLFALIDERYRMGQAGEGGALLVMNEDPARLPASVYSRLQEKPNLIVHNADPDIRPALK